MTPSGLDDRPTTSRGAAATNAGDFSAPRHSCGLILNGGITSGIVYPPAITEIAQDHRLPAVGGSSAGAISAATAAAAELGRSSMTVGFTHLEELPSSLRETDEPGPTPLHRLFQPQAAR